MQNLARSIRNLLHHPRYTLLAVLTLAAGIGAPSAIFGLLDAVYFRPLPVVDPDRLVNVTLASPASRFGALSYEEVRDVERSIPAFKDVIAIGQRGVTLNHSGQSQLLLIHYVSGRYFPSLGIPMHVGRGFTPADDRPDAAAPQVVINHHLWKERLGAPTDLLGRTIQLNSTLFTVIGVTAPGFVGMDRIVRTDVWVTTSQAPLVVPGLRAELDDRRHRWFNVIARLADGVQLDEARPALALLAARWRAADAREYQDARLVAGSWRDADRQEATQGAGFLALVGLVLLIACANVANLTLARGEGRRREMSIRAALGATRIDLMGQMILESAIVSMYSRSRCSDCRRANPALQLFFPVQHDVEVRYGGEIQASGLEDEEPPSVRCDVVRATPDITVVSFEECCRLLCRELGFETHRGRHPLPAVSIEELCPVARPGWLFTAIYRHLPLPRACRIGTHVDFVLAGFIGDIGNPPTVWRKRRPNFVESGTQEFLRRLSPPERQDPEVHARGGIPLERCHELAVGR